MAKLAAPAELHKLSIRFLVIDARGGVPAIFIIRLIDGFATETSEIPRV
jgi:hypothetical protein